MENLATFDMYRRNDAQLNETPDQGPPTQATNGCFQK